MLQCSTNESLDSAAHVCNVITSSDENEENCAATNALLRQIATVYCWLPRVPLIFMETSKPDII